MGWEALLTALVSDWYAHTMPCFILAPGSPDAHDGIPCFGVGIIPSIRIKHNKG